MNRESIHWKVEGENIVCRAFGSIQFSDTEDHWNQGLRRLLGISEEAARAWVEDAVMRAHTQKEASLMSLDLNAQIAVLKEAAKTLFPVSDEKINPLLSTQSGPCGHPADIIWQKGLGADDQLCVVGCSACQHGWLRNIHGGPIVTVYEEEYFEGARHGMGYGSYLQQQAWRMEKARRMLRQTRGACEYAGLTFSEKARVLDVGSGYGFFRKAVDEIGWAHDGLELSAHACSVTAELFGYSTFNGILADYIPTAKERYDLITLWDVIEHVEDPIQLLREVTSLLRPGGVCAIRTPNLLAVEREIFGRYYHSFKREHLQFFSAQSLSLSAQKSGMRPAFITSQSNLLQGFSSANRQLAEMTLRGADLFAILTYS